MLNNSYNQTSEDEEDTVLLQITESRESSAEKAVFVSHEEAWK